MKLLVGIVCLASLGCGAAAAPPTPVATTPNTLARFVGYYALAEPCLGCPRIAIRQSGTSLVAHWAGTASPSRLVPRSELEFVVRGLRGRIAFKRDLSGSVVGFVLRSGRLTVFVPRALDAAELRRACAGWGRGESLLCGQ